MTFRHVGHVYYNAHASSPLVVGDFEHMKKWPGSPDGADGFVKFKSGKGVIFELQLASPDVFVDESRKVVVLLAPLARSGWTLASRFGRDLAGLGTAFTSEPTSVFHDDEIRIESGAMVVAIAYNATPALGADTSALDAQCVSDATPRLPVEAPAEFHYAAEPAGAHDRPRRERPLSCPDRRGRYRRTCRRRSLRMARYLKTSSEDRRHSTAAPRRSGRARSSAGPSRFSQPYQRDRRCSGAALRRERTMGAASGLYKRVFSRHDLDSMIATALADRDDAVRTAWERIRIEPETWRCRPWGEFWVVALEGDRALWFNDVEDGFNWSRYATRGTIDEYFANQTSFTEILEQIAQAQSEATRSRLGESGVPAELVGAGRITFRQSTYWDVVASNGSGCRVHFRDKAEMGFVDAAYRAIEICARHPLLVQYEEPACSLYFTGAHARPHELALAVEGAIRDASDSWRGLDDCASSVAAAERTLRVTAC